VLNRLPADPDDQIAEATPLRGPIDAKIDADVDVDMYKITVQARAEILFDLQEPGVDAFLRLFDASGTELGASDGGLNYTFAAAGTYYVGVSSYDNEGYDPVTGAGDAPSGNFGEYRLNTIQIPTDADDQITEARALALGTPASGTIGTGSDVDMFSFHATAGRPMSVDLDRGVSGVADAILRVFDASGNELAADQGGQAPGEGPNNEAYVQFLPNTTGTYYVGVSGSNNRFYDPQSGGGDQPVGSSTGAYTVTLAEIPNDPDDQVAEAQSVALGSIGTGAIGAPSDVDLYKFTAGAGQRIALDLDRPAGSGLDSILRLFDANGNELLRSDDDPAPGEGPGAESYLEFLTRTAGTYYVGVSANANDSYSPLTGLGDHGGVSTGSYILRFNRLA
jgi:hypothetical protein